MRRADRLFDILLMLRAASAPVTAATLAAALEVTVRTVYRDIATLQARRVPIEGAAGLGYVLRPGFTLPPLMFTLEETDAIAVGMRLVRRLRDPAMQSAADNVLAKVAAVLPASLRDGVAAPAIFISEGSTATPEGLDFAELRRAIREKRKLRITYRDAEGRSSTRTIWPIALAYYVDATVLGAWCQLRGDFRHFRAERVTAAELLDETYPGGRDLMARWFALQRDTPAL